MDYSIIITVLSLLIPAAAAYGGVRQALKGTEERMESIDRKLDGQTVEARNHREEALQRLTAVESKVVSVEHRVHAIEAKVT